MLQIRSKWGTTLVEYEYDAWGNCSIVYTHSAYGSFGEINPIRYRSYFYDFETGFYYLQSRYYDPAIRRFISADDIELLGSNDTFLSFNLYSYAENNPVMNIDSNGTMSVKNLIAKIGELLNQLIDMLWTYLRSLIVFENGTLSISTTLIAAAIDIGILIFIHYHVMTGVNAAINLALKSSWIRSSLIKGILNFFTSRLGQKILSKLVFWAMAAAGKGSIAKSIADAFVGDMITNLLNKQSQLLGKSYSYYSAFSSIGGIISLFFDWLDGDDDGYLNIKFA